MTSGDQYPSPMIDPHKGQPVLYGGEPLLSARAAMILIHGRGSSAEDMLNLVRYLHEPDFAYIAPQASHHTWYPNRFLAPTVTNEPWLSSSLRVIKELVEQIQKPGGPAIPDERLFVLGFSQGACLALEFAARNAHLYGGIIGLSGGLIGPDQTPRDYPGFFEGTPVFLGCSDIDPHIPVERVDLTAQVFRKMGADVTIRLYPGMGHTVNEDEIETVRGMMRRIS